MKSCLALLAALVTAVFLASCSSPAPAPTPAAFNDADVSFATNMIPHHQQAVEMSALVPDRSTNPAVVTLAADIAAAQGPEIETMKGFLVQWNAPAPAHAGHDGMAMDGMVDPAAMTKLEALKGNEFDTLWLSSMIGHHQGAITMAKTELADGSNADAKALAQRIVTAQEAEITQMQQLGKVTHDG